MYIIPSDCSAHTEYFPPFVVSLLLDIDLLPSVDTSPRFRADGLEGEPAPAARRQRGAVLLKTVIKPTVTSLVEGLHQFSRRNCSKTTV